MNPHYPRPVTEQNLARFIGVRKDCECCGRPFRTFNPNRYECAPCVSIVKSLQEK